MSYISEIFDRSNIQHIREFLLHGVKCVKISDKTYKQRIDEIEKPVIDIIQTKFSKIDEYEKISTNVFEYASTIQDVYMEIGLQCGFILAVQLLINPQNE